jgi:hypothetical protein
LYLALWGLAKNEKWDIPLIPIVLLAVIAGLTALLCKGQFVVNDEKDRRARLAERKDIAEQEAKWKARLKREAESKEKAANAPSAGVDSAPREKEAAC